MQLEINQQPKIGMSSLRNRMHVIRYCCWIITAIFAVFYFWPGTDEQQTHQQSLKTQSVSHQNAGFTVPIEKIKVGMRVHAHNPEVDDVERSGFTEPDWSTFSCLDVVMTKFDGGEVEITMLRSPEWMQNHKPVVGGTVPVATTEFNAMGESKVVAICAAPDIDNGPGQVVTATFKHTSSDVLDVYTEGNDMPLGTTATHPFWSVDRQRFVEARNLRPGETLRSMFDEHLKVKFITNRGPPEPVYNVTIHNEHTYYVGEDAVLVHNSNSYDSNSVSQVKRNKLQGDLGEAIVRERLLKNRSVELVGEQIKIRTPSKGSHRITDFIVRGKKTGRLRIIEVKTGNASRDATQVAKDTLIADPLFKSTFFGRRARRAGFQNGTPTGPIRTFEVNATNIDE